MNTTTYPIEIQKISLDHKGATKSYHLLLAARADGKCLLVKRWGRKGQFGSISEELFNTTGFAERAFEKVLAEKTGRGYSVLQETNSNKTAVNAEILVHHFGRPLWAKLSAAAVKQLDEDIDVTGRREPETPRFDEYGNDNGMAQVRMPVYTQEQLAAQQAIIDAEKEEARQLLLEQERAKEAAQAEKVANMRARNPNFGRF